MNKLAILFRELWALAYKYKDSIVGIGLLIYAKVSVGFLNWYISLVTAVLLTVGGLKVFFGVKIPIINNFVGFTEPERTMRMGSNPERLYSDMESVATMFHYNTVKQKILERGRKHEMMKKLKIGFTWFKKNWMQLVEVSVALLFGYFAIDKMSVSYFPILEQHIWIRYVVGGLLELLVIFGIVRKTGFDGLVTISQIVIEKQGLADEVKTFNSQIKDLKDTIVSYASIKKDIESEYNKNILKITTGLLAGDLTALKVKFEQDVERINKQIEIAGQEILHIEQQISDKVKAQKLVK